MSLPPVIIDTREQTPFQFRDGVCCLRDTLQHGDYSLQGFTDLIVIERKSLPDLVACCGRERDRFKRELHSLRGYRFAAVVVEASMKRIMAGNWRGKVQPAHVMGSMASWTIKYGVPFIPCCNAEIGAEYTLYLLRNYYQYCKEYAMRFK